VADLIDLFDSREKALLIWLGIVIVFALAARDVRRHLPTLARTLVGARLAIPLLLTVAYVAGVVAIFAFLGAWDVSVLDVTIFWFFGTALVAFAKSAEAAKDPDFVRNLSDAASLLYSEWSSSSISMSSRSPSNCSSFH
jgi:hypothetical protein